MARVRRSRAIWRRGEECDKAFRKGGSQWCIAGGDQNGNLSLGQVHLENPPKEDGKKGKLREGASGGAPSSRAHLAREEAVSIEMPNPTSSGRRSPGNHRKNAGLTEAGESVK